MTDCYGIAIKLNVVPSNTVSNVLEFLNASKPLPSDVRLVMNGTPLQPSRTVAELQLKESDQLQLSPLLRSSSPVTDTPVVTTFLPETAPQLEAKPATPTPSETSSTSTSKASTPSGRKSNKPRCSKDGCKGLAQPIVGDCGFCQKRFCGKHRMLESHNCEGLDNARQADKDRNAAKLQHERTVMLRGL